MAGVSIDMTSVGRARKVVLVEGGSDKAALEVLAHRRGVRLGRDGICVVAMGGATNIGHFVDLLGPHGLNVKLAGLCDAGAEDHLRRALWRGGLDPGLSPAGLQARGFYVCTTDLEDELIRAVGSAAVERVIAAHGELRPFRTFQRQPAHQHEDLGQQIHRFLGTRSGRKAQYARLLAAAADLDRVPPPLDGALAGS